MTLTRQQAASELLARRKARAGLIDYSKYQWPGYKDAPHHRLIAEHLEAVERGEITRLMINMPPRHGKSMLASEFFPAWYIGKNPGHYVVTSTYAQELADDFGRKVKNQIEDQSFNAVFPGVRLADDSKSAKRFHIDGSLGGVEHATSQRGAFYAVGVGGPLTGRGAHLLLIDDPVKNREEAESEVLRRKVKDWYTSTAYTRLMPGGRIVLIQTRWHEDDLSGWLQDHHKHEGWVVLNLPAINPDGEALWPDQYPVEALERIKRALPTRDWSALYQQAPSPETGDYFKREWIRTVETLPPIETMAIYGASDYAVTSNGGDYTVHVVVGVDHEGRLWLLDMWRGQTSSDIWVEAFCNLVRKWKPIGWAEETGQIKSGVGPFLVKRMIETNAFVAREQFPTRGDKAVRAQSIRARMSLSGLYVQANAPWLSDLISEMMSFPVGVHDDMCVVGETKIATPNGEKRMDSLCIGDEVITPSGVKHVVAHDMTTENARLVRVVMSNGRCIECTPNHPVHVKNKGFVRADTLGIMDELTSIGELECSEEVQTPKWWNISAIDIDAIQTDRVKRIADIFTQQNQGGAFCIVTNGKTPTVQSPRDAISITSTAILPTTTYQTLSVYQRKSIAAGTQWMKANLPSKRITLKEFATRLLNGTGRLKAWLGTRNTGKSLGKGESRNTNGRALNADQNIKLSFQGPVSAQDDAKVRIISVEHLSARRPVYNITVEGEHVYYANGVLTHNCDALGLAGQLMDRMVTGAAPKQADRQLEVGAIYAPPIPTRRR